MAQIMIRSSFRQFLAELTGTTFLTMTVAIALVVHIAGVDFYANLFLPFAAGLVIMLMVYLFGSISGAHFNPAVSLALYVYKKISLSRFVTNLVGQLAGATLGAALTRLLIGEYAAGPQSLALGTIVGEFLGAFLLVFAVMSVLQGRVTASLSGLVIGLAIIVGATITAGADSGIFNPALALGLGSYSYVYLFVPFIGGIAGGGLAQLMHDPVV